MAKGALINSGIVAIIREETSVENLKNIEVGANLPYEKWGIYVAEDKINDAKFLLDSILGEKVKIKHDTLPRKIVKPFIWLYVSAFFDFCSSNDLFSGPVFKFNKVKNYERYYSFRRKRHQALSAHQNYFQTTIAGL